MCRYFIYIFTFTSENITRYHRLKSCNIVYAFERGKIKNMDEFETGTYIYVTDISTHRTPVHIYLYIFIYLFLASSNLNNTTSAQHSEALCHKQPCYFCTENACAFQKTKIWERELNKVNILSQEVWNALRYTWPFCLLVEIMLSLHEFGKDSLLMVALDAPHRLHPTHEEIKNN